MKNPSACSDNGNSKGAISGTHFKVSPVKDNEETEEGETEGAKNDRI